ncbi:hypothetical protein [Microbacterium hydrocarbonoxydans]|uniref:hypothetical protein n=1 Tax=Microbacterium hydrocarbonoxydans TaxID=273678 RepID=UPI00203C0A0D|nr:hypothetical protein [Microbacterium hydrocarbonoxydans]MCM3778171.1 hypothetical protein [Microbacterium hydrocarbonoxydans]
MALPSVVFFAVGGAVLIATFVFNAFRWRWNVARAEREVRDRASIGAFVFIQGQSGGTEGRPMKHFGSGWGLLYADRVELRCNPSPSGLGGSVHRREIPSELILNIYARETTSTSYGGPVIVLSSGEELSFTSSPQTGSGLRGPTDAEIADAVAKVRSSLGR